MADESNIDEPLKDRRGYPRSKATLPEFRKGTSPKNKGMTIKGEILPPEDVKVLLGAFGSSNFDVRDRVIVSLMYAGVKMGQVIRLERPNYEPATGTVTIAAHKRVAKKEIVLDRQARQSIDAWMDLRKSLGIGLYAPLICVINGRTKGMRLGAPQIQTMLKHKAEAAGLERRVSAEGLRQSGAAHRKGSRSRVGAYLQEYLDDESFQARYPEAFERWESALDLFTAHPTRHADRIGHDCRAAMLTFIDAKLALQGVEASGGTVTKLRALIAAAPRSDAIDAHLQSLVRFWGTSTDLIQRQEHAAHREGEALGTEDCRRAITFTLLAMLEIDRTIASPSV